MLSGNFILRQGSYVLFLTHLYPHTCIWAEPNPVKVALLHEGFFLLRCITWRTALSECQETHSTAAVHTPTQNSQPGKQDKILSAFGFFNSKKTSLSNPTHQVSKETRFKGRNAKKRTKLSSPNTTRPEWTAVLV